MIKVILLNVSRRNAYTTALRCVFYTLLFLEPRLPCTGAVQADNSLRVGLQGDAKTQWRMAYCRPTFCFGKNAARLLGDRTNCRAYATTVLRPSVVCLSVVCHVCNGVWVSE